MIKKRLENIQLLHQILKLIWLRLPPCFSNLLPHIYRVNHSFAFFKRVDELFIEAPNPHDDKQGWLKNQSNL